MILRRYLGYMYLFLIKDFFFNYTPTFSETVLKCLPFIGSLFLLSALKIRDSINTAD